MTEPNWSYRPQGVTKVRIIEQFVEIIFLLQHSATVQGTESYSCQQKRTHQLGFAERSKDILQTSPFKQLSTNIRRKEQSDLESATRGEIAQAI